MQLKWTALVSLIVALFSFTAHAQPTSPDSLPGCVYNATPPTLSDRQQAPWQCDVNGKLLANATASSIVPGTTVVTGGAANCVLFNNGGTLECDNGFTKAAGTTGQVTIGGNLICASDGGCNLGGAGGRFNTGIFAGNLTIFQALDSATTFRVTVNQYQLNGTSGQVSWSNNNVASGTIDTTLSRSAAGVLQIGASTGRASTGSLLIANLQAGIIYSAAGTPLPSCVTGLQGTRAVVSDATGPTYLGSYTSGGAVVADVLCNGTTWVMN